VRAEDLRALSPREDRRAGAILGLAVGDALGATHEFRSPGDVPGGPLGMTGGGVFGWAPGETTDDTALAKAVLEGYRKGTLEHGRVRDAMIRWRDTDPRDIGNQTRKALDYLTRHPEALSLPEEPEAQGNGAVRNREVSACSTRRQMT
jgi:ADP-ribosyl-[dinitrogen reductase] hydrolase